MRVTEIRSWTTDELQRRINEAYRELFTLRREWALGRLQDHNRVKVVKRDIARMRTILKERELGAALTGGGKVQ